MVQTYGVAPDEDSQPTPTNYIDAMEGESSALLGGNASVKRVNEADGRASIVSCVSNLSNTIIGSGESCFCYKSITITDEVIGMLTFPLVS
jgi:hypothetical protein